MLVHVVFALLALMAFSAFTIDYGVLWASRRQAQNSADAAALAGAGAFMDDPLQDQTDTGPAKQTALRLSQVNPVWGQSPSVNVTTDITFLPCPDEDPTSVCLRADVYRTQARANPLPSFFGSLVGISNQDIRAMAIAKLAVANASKCIKPWGVRDKWDENNPDPDWVPTSTYDPTGGTPDIYIPQNGTNPGTGWTVANDYGTEFLLKNDNPQASIHPSWFQPLDLFAPGSICTNQGASCYRDAIAGCIGTMWGIGDVVPKETGNMVGPTNQGTQDLIDLDPTADWDPLANGGKGEIINSCVSNNSCPGGIQYSESPRIVALPVFDTDLYYQTGGPGAGTVKIVNILGFFVDRIVSGDVYGYLVTKPDLSVTGKGGVAGPASFVKSLVLVR
jgi:hypothetical protein